MGSKPKRGMYCAACGAVENTDGTLTHKEDCYASELGNSGMINGVAIWDRGLTYEEIKYLTDAPLGIHNPFGKVKRDGSP